LFSFSRSPRAHFLEGFRTISTLFWPPFTGLVQGSSFEGVAAFASPRQNVAGGVFQHYGVWGVLSPFLPPPCVISFLYLSMGENPRSLSVGFLERDGWTVSAFLFSLDDVSAFFHFPPPTLPFFLGFFLQTSAGRVIGLDFSWYHQSLAFHRRLCCLPPFFFFLPPLCAFFEDWWCSSFLPFEHTRVINPSKILIAVLLFLSSPHPPPL